ncbi:unnamed protein product [Rhizophagus irregularis]|nr:unnamed protein product [Rhizophagus irregularis]
MRSDFSRLHSSSSQSLEMPGTESARSSRGGMEITSSINDVNSPGYEKLFPQNQKVPYEIDAFKLEQATKYSIYIFLYPLICY